MELAKTPKNRMDMYQYVTSDVLNYFFIRNNVYVENLDADKWDFMSSHIERAAQGSSSAEIEAYVERTFGKALKEYLVRDHEEISSFLQYGPNSSKYFAPNDAIVLGFRYDRFFISDGEDDNTWSRRHDRQREFPLPLVERMETETASRLPGHVVKVLEYDDYSSGPSVASVHSNPQHDASLSEVARKTGRFDETINKLVRGFIATIGDTAAERKELESEFRKELQNCVLYNDAQWDAFSHLSDDGVAMWLSNIARELREKRYDDKCRALLKDESFNLLKNIQHSLERAVQFQSAIGMAAGCIDYSGLREAVPALALSCE